MSVSNLSIRRTTEREHSRSNPPFQDEILNEFKHNLYDIWNFKFEDPLELYSTKTSS